MISYRIKPMKVITLHNTPEIVKLLQDDPDYCTELCIFDRPYIVVGIKPFRTYSYAKGKYIDVLTCKPSHTIQGFVVSKEDFMATQLMNDEAKELYLKQLRFEYRRLYGKKS